jgi:hypothetical protein
MEHRVQKINVLVTNRPRLLRELVMATLDNQRDIEVLHQEGQEEISESDLVASIEQLQPDFLITTFEKDGELSKHCAVLLKRFPKLKIIAMAPHSDQCVLYARNPRIYSAPIVLSEEGILKALRGQTRSASESAGRQLRKAG